MTANLLTLTLVLLIPSAKPTTGHDKAFQGDPLKTLRKEHPRLIGLPADLERIKKLIESDPNVAKLAERVRRDADKVLGDSKPLEHRLIGPRLLDMSRLCVARVYSLATAYRFTGERRYAEGAIGQMLTAAGFPDWNPRHFLDTAEMTHALAIGYDWLYDVLTPEQRKQIRAAIVVKGLREGEKVYRESRWWARSEHNWNQVCNGGMVLGALAVAEDEPQLARYIVEQAVRSVPLAMASYAPDGGWGEGPGYWHYATSYNVYLLAALESALGADFGLSRAPGFSVTGDFNMHCIGPTGLSFNFSDAHAGPGRAECMLWLARKFDNPTYAWYEREVNELYKPLHLWWYDARGAQPDDIPNDRHFKGIGVVFLRGKWHDPRTSFVGFRGGDNKVNHSHLELGTFVLDALGQRWAFDLGSDNYNLPGYFGKQRWSYYRLGTQGQNTLLIDQQNQSPTAVAPIVAFSSGADRSHAVADLSAAYAGQAAKVRRGIAMLDRRDVLVQDEIDGCRGREVVWQIHTKAQVHIENSQATLQLGGQTLYARLISPSQARFEVQSANPPPPQAQEPDAKKLVVRTAPGKGPLRIAVLFSPDRDALSGLSLTPLARWSNGSSRR